MVDVFEGPEPKKGRRPKWWLAAGKGVAAGVVLVLALLWLSAGSAVSLFPAKSQRVYVVFKSVGGLKKGEKVQVAGLPKGKVTDLGITDVVVEAEGRVKLDEETMRELLRHAQLEDTGEPVEIQAMGLSSLPREETPRKDPKDLIWTVSVLVQKGSQATPEVTNGTIRLNNDLDVPPELRQKLVASFEDMALTRAVNVAMHDASGDFDTVFHAFTRDDAEAKLDEVGDPTPLFVFSVKVRMPQQMVLCTLEMDDDVPLGADLEDLGKRPPYLITVEQTTPLIGTPFVAMERTPKGKPVVLPRNDDERRNVRKRPLNLGKQEATDLGQLAESFRELGPKFDKTFKELQQAVSSLSSLAYKADKGDGMLAMFVNDPGFRDDFKKAVADLRSIVRKVETGEGSFGKFISEPTLHDDLVKATQRLDDVLVKVQSGGGFAQRVLDDPKLYDEALAASTEAKQVLEKINKGSGLLAAAINDEGLKTDFEEALKGVKDVSVQMREGKGIFAALLNDEGLKADFQMAVTDTRNLMGDLGPVAHDIREGKSALGKLAVDPKLGRKVEEAINSAAETFGGIARTKTFLGVTSKYWGTTERWVTKGYIRVAPRENMFVSLGGVVLSTAKDSPIDSDPDDEGETIFKP
ncbi:MAG: MlaD family protein, partial [Planctomycetota bacterium]